MRQYLLIKEVAEKLNQKQTKVKSVIGHLIDEINQHLLDGNEVEIMNFGKFSTFTSKERVVVIPGKNDLVKVPPYVKVHFKVSQNLKKEIQSLKR